MDSSQWDPKLLLDLRAAAFRALRKLNLPTADAEDSADAIQDGVARQARERIVDPFAYVSRAAQYAAQRFHARNRFRDADVEQIPAAPLDEDSHSEQRTLDAKEALGLDLARWLAAAPELLDYMPDSLEDYLSILAERWLEERGSNKSESQRDLVWVLAALARGEEEPIRRMAAIAKRSFPRERFLEMTRETDKPPLARSEEELARLMLDCYVNRLATSTVSAARRLVDVARTAWPPLAARADLEPLAQQIIALAAPDRRVQGAREKKISEGRQVVRGLLKAWGFSGTDNYLKRI